MPRPTRRCTVRAPTDRRPPSSGGGRQELEQRCAGEMRARCQDSGRSTVPQYRLVDVELDLSPTCADGQRSVLHQSGRRRQLAQKGVVFRERVSVPPERFSKLSDGARPVVCLSSESFCVSTHPRHGSGSRLRGCSRERGHSPPARCPFHQAPSMALIKIRDPTPSPCRAASPAWSSRTDCAA